MHLRSGRALLKWSRGDLCGMSGLTEEPPEPFLPSFRKVQFHDKPAPARSLTRAAFPAEWRSPSAPAPRPAQESFSAFPAAWLARCPVTSAPTTRPPAGSCPLRIALSFRRPAQPTEDLLRWLEP